MKADKNLQFRWHRGSLDDSMATVVPFATLSELASILKDGGLAGKIEIKPYGYDDRIRWDSHIVTVNGSPVGFTSGPVQ